MKKFAAVFLTFVMTMGIAAAALAEETTLSIAWWGSHLGGGKRYL